MLRFGGAAVGLQGVHSPGPVVKPQEGLQSAGLLSLSQLWARVVGTSVTYLVPPSRLLTRKQAGESRPSVRAPVQAHRPGQWTGRPAESHVAVPQGVKTGGIRAISATCRCRPDVCPLGGARECGLPTCSRDFPLHRMSCTAHMQGLVSTPPPVQKLWDRGVEPHAAPR